MLLHRPAQFLHALSVYKRQRGQLLVNSGVSLGKKKKEKKRLFLQRKSCNIHGAYDLGSVANKACSLLLKDGQWSWCLRFSDHNPDVICIATAEHVQNLSKQTSSTCWHFRGSKGPFCGYFSENSRMFEWLWHCGLLCGGTSTCPYQTRLSVNGGNTETHWAMNHRRRRNTMPCFHNINSTDFKLVFFLEAASLYLVRNSIAGVMSPRTFQQSTNICCIFLCCNFSFYFMLWQCGAWWSG